MKEVIIAEFSAGNALDWQVVNDGVMGGLSESSMTLTAKNTAIFEGSVSLLNNGGFASVRANLDNRPFPSFQKIAIRVKGDGKIYQLRFRHEANFDGLSYRAMFETNAGEWQTHTFFVADFTPVFRGRIIAGQPPLGSQQLRQVSFLIAEKQEGAFRLEIDWIKGF